MSLTILKSCVKTLLSENLLITTDWTVSTVKLSSNGGVGKHYIDPVSRPTWSCRPVFKKKLPTSWVCYRVWTPPRGSVRVRTLPCGRQGRCSVYSHPVYCNLVLHFLTTTNTQDVIAHCSIFFISFSNPLSCYKNDSTRNKIAQN